MSQSVYQKILGEDFHKLGPSLQFSHGSEKFVKASGPIDVIYGKNIFVRWLNKLSKMPPEGVQQNVVLTIERNAKQEVWTRDFNGKIFRTIQFEKNGYLIERSGPVSLKFLITITENNILFLQKQTLFFGIPAPRFLELKSKAHSIEEENGWKVEVEVRSFLFGLMLRYRGEVKITSVNGII